MQSQIIIYDTIGQIGYTAMTFLKELNDSKEPPTHIKINSPGGEVFEGMAIYNATKQHKGKTISHIDGVAAGIASIIPFATEEIWMREDAWIMISNPSQFVIGSPYEMRTEVANLSKIIDSLVNIYTEALKKTEKEIRSMMTDETWISANDAVEMGFINGDHIE